MGDQPKKRSWGWIGWALFTVFVLYPLSIGPVTLLIERTWNRPLENAYRVIYSPLEVVVDAWDPLGELLIQYILWWDPDFRL
jgi:hypothetical protein